MHFLGEQAGVRRAGATERDQRVLARIDAFLPRDA
jgi:hypothetical protein